MLHNFPKTDEPHPKKDEPPRHREYKRASIFTLFQNTKMHRMSTGRRVPPLLDEDFSDTVLDSDREDFIDLTGDSDQDYDEPLPPYTPVDPAYLPGGRLNPIIID